ncbi:MAG: prepilin-type N-terminal cleavage/methylation domain-containing protein [Phycisphaeraceae bacterium]|nr:prepilin-type N-terminal cleavage/methylation domain-containing protein [Phycisphaeraceae bacterium]
MSMLFLHARRAPAFTLIELLVVITIIALLIGILLPSLGTARLSAQKTVCSGNAKSLAIIALAYSGDHNGLCPPDRRSRPNGNPLLNYRGLGTVDVVPRTKEDFDKSWLGILQAGGYISSDPNVYDCPVADDHRKLPEDASLLPRGEQRIWYTDYVMAHFAINQSTETAADPLRCMILGEPNMPRGSIVTFEYTIASNSWFPPGGRRDLEQHKAGSLSFAFVDGHVARVPIPTDDPYPRQLTRQVYPDIFLPAAMSSMRCSPSTKIVWRDINLRDADGALYMNQGPKTQ